VRFGAFIGLFLARFVIVGDFRCILVCLAGYFWWFLRSVEILGAFWSVGRAISGCFQQDFLGAAFGNFWGRRLAVFSRIFNADKSALS